MKDWFLCSLATLFLWGLWGFFPKLATRHIQPPSILVYEVLGTLVIGLIACAYLGFRPEMQVSGMLFAFFGGVCGAVGLLFFLFALRTGKVSVVVTLTALYPLVTLLLAFVFLREPITWTQGAGIALAIVAMALISA